MCIGFVWQDSGSGGGREVMGSFCEKLLDAPPVSSRANVDLLQKSLTG